MNISKKTKKAGIFATTLSVIMIVLIGVFLSGMLKPSLAQPQYPKDHLFVDATYLLKTDETNDSVDITCNLYLTNIWEKESGEIKAVAYVIETSNNFAVFKNTVEIGVIGANQTAEIEIPVVLSNNSYKVEILIFENGKLVIKGVLTISAHPVYVWRDIDRGKGEKELVLEGWSVVNTKQDFYQVR